ncbi:YrhC family protein [Bacillus rhizoplanae]|uniref:YrhC family protein n=1 Tax=Bacillus rhizoplanae TaxID=2880966 RepID=UPI003D2098D4
MKELQQKIADYIRFGQVMLALSAFLMLGLLLPNGQKETVQMFAMMGVIVAFLGGSFYFFRRAKELRDKLEENENEQVL